ncbi:MAG: BamA/TamA family outer membrane protein [Sandaracinaceae bacterium]|nr:BamA/TamA family outer membrane protein [Sandaracinaceae bacterium]
MKWGLLTLGVVALCASGVRAQDGGDAGMAATDASVVVSDAQPDVASPEREDAGEEPAIDDDAVDGEALVAPPAEEGTEGSDFAGRPRTTPELPRIRYFLERIEVHTDGSTRPSVIRNFVPLESGAVLDVDDPDIEAVRWRLLGTGWFRDVRLSLQRGSQRGWVVLVIDVEERNTLIVEQVVAGVSQGVRAADDMVARLIPYGGLSIAETNLLGTGVTLSGAGVISSRQQGGRIRYINPSFLGSPYVLSSSLFLNNAREFFGYDDALVSIRCPPPEPDEIAPPTCPEEVLARSAVVRYQRLGLSLGTGRDLGASTRYTLDWQGELVNVLNMPDAASESRGTHVQAIDFSINRGHSVVSAIQFGLIYDRRDDPALPTRGVMIQFRGDYSSPIIGSDYEFLRLQISAQHYVPLPWGHVLRFGGFAGAVFGRAPFFYKFYASDLSDLLPSRALELNLDRRPPPNLLNTAIAEMLAEDLAARVDIGYSIPLYRGGNGFYALDAYAAVGVYALMGRRDVSVAIPGYTGFSQIPIDLTFDLGVRMDTSVGVFQFGISNVLGFIAQ